MMPWTALRPAGAYLDSPAFAIAVSAKGDRLAVGGRTHLTIFEVRPDGKSCPAQSGRSESLTGSFTPVDPLA